MSTAYLRVILWGVDENGKSVHFKHLDNGEFYGFKDFPLDPSVAPEAGVRKALHKAEAHLQQIARTLESL